MKRLMPPVVKRCRVQDMGNEKVLVAHTTLAKSVCAHIIKKRKKKKHNNWNLSEVIC